MTGQEVTIIGAGAVGVCTALYLQRDGYRVTLIDQDEPGQGCSYGNAGLIQCASVVPLATPGVLRSVPRMLLDPEQPLIVRWQHLPSLLPFLTRFVLSASPAKVRRSAAALATIIPKSFAAYQPLLESAGLLDMIRKTGELHVYESDAAYKGAALGRLLRQELGIRVKELTSEQVREREPAISRAVKRGVLLPDAYQTADPYKVVSGLAKHFVEKGGNFRQERVEDVIVAESGPTHLMTSAGLIPVGKLVIAAGAFSKAFAERLGSYVPLDSERGYHLMLPEPRIRLGACIISGDYKIAIAPLENGIRVTGSAELARVGAAADFTRAQRLLPIARRLLPGLEGEGRATWMGHRPSTPDSLPVIGRSPVHRSVFYAFGHNHSGLTLAGITGKLITELVSEEMPSVDLTPFSVQRFATRPWAVE